jgi:hypothetical protein
MSRAPFVSLHLARFDTLRVSEDPVCGDWAGVLFCQVGADSRAAGTEPPSREAFVFVVLGLHADPDSAERVVNDRHEAVPWLDDAPEVWSAVLQPFRHKGKANYLAPADPDKFLEPSVVPPPLESPTVVLTSIGWDKEDLDMTRVADVGQGTGAVRASMTAVPGLYCQHSFFFPGVLDYDVMTVSLWQDTASVNDFAYHHPPHRRQMDRYRATNNADRTSFTRLTALRSRGTWYGADPVGRHDRAR